ncbi:MAG: erythronate-4-phosphate dehydrogenase, partial [Bacteroidaceae bacterium]|nr:erythronate-4-phosphate dehydrogenase [Bacteroidaceae bacterium]
AGMQVLLNDPPRAQREGGAGFVPLSKIAWECDIITFHPTLSSMGEFPSYHLADAGFMASLKNCRLLINASRGPVVDNKALLEAMERGVTGDVVLDVWENEPNVDERLLNKVYIGTPHIAGYSAEGKMNATRQVLEAFASFLGYDGKLPLPAMQPPCPDAVRALSLADALLQIYSPQIDSLGLKENPSAFEELRNNYMLRREPTSYKLLYKK